MVKNRFSPSFYGGSLQRCCPLTTPLCVLEMNDMVLSWVWCFPRFHVLRGGVYTECKAIRYVLLCVPACNVGIRKAFKEYFYTLFSCEKWYPMEHCASDKMWMCRFINLVSASFHSFIFFPV